MKLKISVLITFALLLITDGVFAQSFKVVVNSSNSVTALTKKEASDLFLKKKSKWTDGNAVSPVDLSSSSKVREEFSQQVLGKSISAVRNFWQQAAFSGTASAPTEKSSDEEVIEFIKKNPGGIGYVSSSANTSGVKTVSIN